MPTIIKTKNSVTATNVPSSLQQGEVAINITDKKVWVGNAATTPILLLGSGADGTFTNLSVTGVATFGAGTVSLPSITTTGDTNTGIFFPAADTIAFTEGGAESMRITSAGNVGIDITSPAYRLQVRRAGGVGSLGVNIDTTVGFTRDVQYYSVADSTSGTTGHAFYVRNGTATDNLAMRIDNAGNVGIGTSSPATKLEIKGTHVAGKGLLNLIADAGTRYTALSFTNDTTQRAILFYDNTDSLLNVYGAAGQGVVITTNDAERMRITSAGNVGIGTSSPAVPLEVVGQIRSSGSTARAMYIFGAAGVKPYLTINEFGVRDWDLSAGNFSSGTFSIQSGGSNGVYLNGAAATSWSSASDERVKTDLKPIENAATKVSTLRAVTGRYKTDEVGVSRSFLIAQDVQAVLPEAVGAAVMSDGSEVLGLAYTEVIPLLVAAIKELKAEIDLLKGK